MNRGNAAVRHCWAMSGCTPTTTVPRARAAAAAPTCSSAAASRVSAGPAGLEVAAAVGGECQAARVALEQSHAELTFERAHQFGDRGHAHIELARRTREAACLRSGDEISQRSKAVHVYPRVSGIRRDSWCGFNKSRSPILPWASFASDGVCLEWSASLTRGDHDGPTTTNLAGRIGSHVSEPQALGRRRGLARQSLVHRLPYRARGAHGHSLSLAGTAPVADTWSTGGGGKPGGRRRQHRGRGGSARRSRRLQAVDGASRAHDDQPAPVPEPGLRPSAAISRRSHAWAPARSC